MQGFLEKEGQCAAGQYINRQAESLVLRGYRSWLHGLVLDDPRLFEEVWNLYASKLGSQNGRFALNALEKLIKNLGVCARCPLRFLSKECQHICRDECLILSTIAAIQHGDDDALRTSMSAICGKDRQGQVLAPAGEYALILKASNEVLLPIPDFAVRDIIARSAQPQYQPSSTLH